MYLQLQLSQLGLTHLTELNYFTTHITTHPTLLQLESLNYSSSPLVCATNQQLQLEIHLANLFSTLVNYFQVLIENRLMFIIQLLLRDNNSRHASINRHVIYKYTLHIHLNI